MLTGGCRCGGVRYTLAVDRLPPVYCCHCTDCQKWSGSAFVEQAVIRPEALTHMGDCIEADVRMPSGSVSHQFGCPQCLSRLRSTNPARADVALLRAGTLDQAGSIRPRGHIWVGSRQGWVILEDHVPRFEGAPSETEWKALLTGRSAAQA